MRNPTNIYFARGATSGLVKIGASGMVSGRMQSIASQWLEPVDLLGTVRGLPSLEHDLHRRFSALREPKRGLEWFHDDGSISAIIDAIPEWQRGCVRFVPLGDQRPLRFPTTHELFFPTACFPREVVEALAALRAQAVAA